MSPWLLAVFTPLLTAGLILILPSDSRWAGRILALSPVPALCVALFADLDLTCELDFFLLGTRLGFGLFERTLPLLTALVWSMSALFIAAGQSKDMTPGFLCMFALTMCGNLGLTAAQDALSFYTFFALMTFAAYSLVIHTGTDKARRAGRIYLIMAVGAEGLLIAGFMLAVFHSPSHYLADITLTMAKLPPSHLVFWCFFAGFGVKAGIIFLHFWLPLAHPMAPTPASAVLSGAMIKAGLLGWMLFFPLGAASFPGWGTAFMILGLGSAFFGALAGLGEDYPKTILAYSSISQMGLMSFGLGLGLYDQTLWAVAGQGLEWLIINHALSKTALFLGTALIGASLSNPAQRRLFLAGLCLPGLALAGASFTAGDQAKYLLKKAAEAGPGGELSLGLLFLSSLLTTVLIVHFLRHARQLSGKEQITALQVWTWIPGLILIAGLPVYFPFLLSGLTAQDLHGPSASALIPLASGGALYLMAHKPLCSLIRKIQGICPDPSAGMDAIWHHGTAVFRQGFLTRNNWLEMNIFAFLDQAISGDSGREKMRHLEYSTTRWPVFGFCFTALLLLLAGWTVFF